MDYEAIEKLPAWLKNLLTFASGVFLLWLLFYGYGSRRARKADPRYTIGQVTGTSYVVSASSHSVTFFTYKVGGHTYHSSSSGDLADGCTRCLVEYATNDPENAEFYNQLCLPDSIPDAPAAGWVKPPISMPAGED